MTKMALTPSSGLQRERDELILTSRLKGRTLREIADEHGMTPEDVRLVIARHGRRQIDRIELALLANTKSDDVLAFLIPDHGGEDFDTAMEYCRWVVAELTERGVSVAVH